MTDSNAKEIRTGRLIAISSLVFLYFTYHTPLYCIR